MAFDRAWLVRRVVGASTSSPEDQFEVEFRGEVFAVRRVDLRLWTNRFGD